MIYIYMNEMRINLDVDMKNNLRDLILWLDLFLLIFEMVWLVYILEAWMNDLYSYEHEKISNLKVCRII